MACWIEQMNDALNAKPMKVIGITGGVGSGKSTVTAALARMLDAPEFVMDLVARNLMEPGGACYKNVLVEFGEGILDDRGRVDRVALAKMAFKDPASLQRLNEITHPEVYKEMKKFIKKCESDRCPIVLIETALLSKEFEDACDEIWVVNTPDEIRIQRLMSSRNYSRERCEDMLSKQASHEQYVAVATEIIENAADWKETESALRELCQRKFG